MLNAYRRDVMHSCRTWALVVISVAGCAVEAPTFNQISQAFQECPETVCGANSPNIESHGFHDLHVAGKTNAQGIRLVGARLGRRAYDLSVVNSELFASNRGIVLSGQALVGLKIDLLVDNVPYQLDLMKIGRLSYPVPAGTSDVVSTYVFEYVDRFGERKNLCAAPSKQPADVVYEETFGQRPTEAILFEGDRIYTDSMTVDTAIDTDWFNIGCAGHTLAKLHLTRNTWAAHASAFGHSRSDQQATLKMLAADYCGTGHPFTVAGQRLGWHDPQKVMEYFSPPFSLEARWTESGAACLNEPRMLYPTTVAGALAFPDIYDAIRQECPALLTTPCTDPTNLNDFYGTDRVSANR
jgi:ADYC domain